MKTKRDLIVVGASEGGIEALRTLLSGFPPSIPAAILIVIHTSPQSPMQLATMIGRDTQLRVQYGLQGQSIQHGHVYLAPPDLHMSLQASAQIVLHRTPKVRFSRPAVDVLFHSAAATFGKRVIGVVLTGGDGDGTAGLKAITSAGGLGMVQHPDEAQNPSMPLHALRGAHPHYEATLEKMPNLLMRLVTAATADLADNTLQ